MKVGLGPVVCPSCMIYAHAPLEKNWKEWRCTACGTDVLEYLWLFTDEEQKTINSNSKFYRFVEGKE
jgi:hypothetical protein